MTDPKRLARAYAISTVRRVSPKVQALVVRYLELAGVTTEVEAMALGAKDALDGTIPAKPWSHRQSMERQHGRRRA